MRQQLHMKHGIHYCCKLLGKSDILPLLHTSPLRQDSGTYHRQGNASAIEDLCSLLRSSSLRSSNEDASLQLSEEQILGEFEALHLQSNQDPVGLAALLEDWFTIEDSEIVKLDEVEMILEKEHHTTDDQEHQSDDTGCDTGCSAGSSHDEDHETDSDDSCEQSSEQSRKDILNGINIEESMQMVRSLLHTSSLLSEDDTTNLLTKVYRRCLEWEKEKFELNSRQTVLRDYFQPTEVPVVPMEY